MEITMIGLDRLSVCKTVVYLTVCAVFLVAATPLPATESEIKAQPADATKSEAVVPAEAPPAAAVAEPDTAICIDADAGESSGVNTLEDIYSLSRGNLAVLLKLEAEPTAEKTSAEDEVVWTETKKTTETAKAD
jgi:hypothetical protein